MSFTCLLCGNIDSGQTVSDSLRDEKTGRFHVVRCLTCGHTQVSPLPTAEEDDAFYMRDKQVRGIMETVDLEVWRKKAVDDTARRSAWVMSKLTSQADAVLDIGCGYGFFVHDLAQKGYNAVGVEISEDRIQMARTHQGTFLQKYVDEAFVSEYHKQFKVVTLFHVLEHVRNPVEFVKLISGLVADDGYLFIEVPNLSDDLLNHDAAYKAFYWQRAHLSYFDPSRLELVFMRAGFAQWTIAGVQRYGLRNLLHWLDHHAPQLQDPNYKTSDTGLAVIERLYRADRERSMLSDTLIAEVKPNG